MAFNQVLYNKHLRNEKTAKLLDYEVVESSKGMQRRKFNYMSGRPKKIFDSMSLEYKRNGIPMKEMIDNMDADRLPMFKKELMEMLSGEIPIPVHEFFALIKLLGFDMELIRKENFHEYEWQKDRLIIRRLAYPKLYVNINPDDLSDFEYVIEEKTKKPMSKTKQMKLLLIAIKSYFQANGGSTPFNKKYTRQNFVEDFNRKYYTDQIRHK